jgi:glucose/arabinose dehydrogenase
MVKFKYDGDSLLALDTLIEDIRGNTTHIGCRLLILPDNTLLMTTGDAQNQPSSQDTNLHTGKILRMHLDGRIPSDNPRPNSYVYSYGHRNAQGLWLAPNGLLYSSEHGPTTDDELNIVLANKNYGWPNVSGFCDSPPEKAFCAGTNVEEPLAIWTPTIAPSDIIWYSHPSIPEFKDKLLMTTLKDKSLISFGFDASGDSVISQDKYLKGRLGRLRDICVSPDGKIYLATNGSSWTNTNPFTHSIVELSNEDFVSIGKRHVLDRIQLGPNPVSRGEILSLQVPKFVHGKFTIYDISGRVVLSHKLQDKEPLIIETNNGVYLWRIELSTGEFKQGKLLVN